MRIDVGPWALNRSVDDCVIVILPLYVLGSWPRQRNSFDSSQYLFRVSQEIIRFWQLSWKHCMSTVLMVLLISIGMFLGTQLGM